MISECREAPQPSRAGWVGWAERRVLDRPAKMLTRATPNPSAWSADRAVFGKVVWGIMLKHHEDQ
jgi:hypothetical protein